MENYCNFTFEKPKNNIYQMKHYLSLIFAVGFFMSALTLSAGNLEEGWKAFAENDLEKAEQLFKKATSNPSSKAEAYIGLSLLKKITEDYNILPEIYSFRDD